MRLVEFADAEEQLALWKLVSDSVWAAVAQQAEQQHQEKVEKARQAKLHAKAKPPKSAPLLDIPFPEPPPPLPKPKPLYPNKTTGKASVAAPTQSAQPRANQQQAKSAVNNQLGSTKDVGSEDRPNDPKSLQKIQ
jgi:hypothetical protein